MELRVTFILEEHLSLFNLSRTTWETLQSSVARDCFRRADLLLNDLENEMEPYRIISLIRSLQSRHIALTFLPFISGLSCSSSSLKAAVRVSASNTVRPKLQTSVIA